MYKLALFIGLWMTVLFGCDRESSYENTTFVVTLEESSHTENGKSFRYKVENVASGAVKKEDDVIFIRSRNDLFEVGDTVVFKKKGG